jgi:hydroxyacylglutathione hydrolase
MVRVTPIHCLRDNYAYLVEDPESGETAVVDPSEADPVIEVAEKGAKRPVAVLCTHHHSDHVGGNHAISRRWPSVRVYGHASDEGRIACQTEFVQDGAEIALGRERIRVLHVPGHTRGSVAYLVGGAVFTGDTLFLAGCGFILEGTAATMFRSLNHVIARIDPDVRVFCGHEYTVNNLMFAQWVEPNNLAIEERLHRTSALRARNEPTVGAAFSEELRTNPFLRCGSPEIRARLRLGPDAPGVDVLARLRRAKDEEF